MDGNVNSTDFIINVSICDAGTFELLRLSTLIVYIFCLFVYGRCFLENYRQPRIWILITRVRLLAVQK